MIQEEIKNLLQHTLKELHIIVSDISVEPVSENKFGDYTSNIALKLSKDLKKKPLEIAQDIVCSIQKNKHIEKVEVAPPGFINFYLSKQFIISELQTIPNTVLLNINEKKRVIVEYTDPNPFKELHIGHLFSNTVGESISRIMEASGATVRRVNYQGDVGLHVAKSVWGLDKKLNEDQLTIADIEQRNINDRVQYLGQAYAKGSVSYVEDITAQQEIKNLNAIIYSISQEELTSKTHWIPQINYEQQITNSHLDKKHIKELYLNGKKWSLEYFEVIYHHLGTYFDDYYFESIVGEYGVQIVKEFLTKGVFEESQGAVIYNGEKRGLHTRVFINSLGLPTYEAKELGLSSVKYSDWNYDKSIIVTGTEIKEYFKVLMSTMKETNPSIAEKTIPLTHGMIKLPEGKMSSRNGNVVTIEWLINEAKNKLLTVISSNDNVPLEDKDGVADTLAICAIKYSLLRTNIGQDVVFTFDESLSFDGNSGPYLQYTYVRAQSILRKESTIQTINNANHILLEPEESILIRKILLFPLVLTNASTKLQPHLVCNYLFEIAQLYNNFYHKFSVLKSEGDIKTIRLRITHGVSNILKQGLELLGAKVVEKM
ncbi:MAG: arginine--tRNA ligase [Candidatus Roizmanbacteria bacterium]